MSGYKRVSFYELCRLCASNTQKEKTHIFQDEGKKIQLQNKIQVCLALTVNENDFLPKVVCSKCLRTLETCFSFRQECVRSESMLSAYFKNFRYTDDFKRSGKVYIKDIKPPPPVAIPQNPEISTSANIGSTAPVSTATTGSQNIFSVNKNQQNVEQVPFYTLQLPTIVSNPNVARNQKDLIDEKTQLSQNQFAYNLNLVNTAKANLSVPKTEILSNVVVNSNGEVINIAHMGDFETILSQGSIVKSKHKSSRHSRDVNHVQDDVVHIDLTEDNSPMYELDDDIKYNKLPHIKSTQAHNKYSYSLKVDDKNQNQTVIFPISEYNQNFNGFTSANAIYTQSNLNLVNSTDPLAINTNVICNAASNLNNTSLNINVVNPNLQDIGQAAYTNVISTVTSSNNSSEPEDSKVPLTDSNNMNNSSDLSPTSNSSTHPKIHSCEVCSRAFKRKEHLYQHVKLHTGFRPYVCEHCNKAFMRKEHLIRHSTLHSGQKNYTCNVCDKSFSRNDNLLKHKKTHEKQTSYTCDICQKQFVMKHYYNAHKLSHGDKCYVSAVWGMLKT